MSEYRIFSFGGGVQSVAAMVLQAQGRLNYDAFVFANVGDDSENPATLVYLRDVVRPYAETHGIKLYEVERTFNGELRTLYDQLTGDQRDVPIPVYMANGAPGNRRCTNVWKIDAIDHWLKEREIALVHIGIGFSTDEMRRVTEPVWTEVSKCPPLWKIREYPLIDLSLSREACRVLIRDAGLPTPPKSACWFCPYTSRSQWVEMKRRAPELFNQAVELEQRINEKRTEMGRDEVYLHPALQALEQAVPDQLALMDIWNDDQECGTGYCGL